MRLDLSRNEKGFSQEHFETCPYLRTKERAEKAEAEVERLKADLVFKQIDYNAFARMKQRAEKAEAALAAERERSERLEKALRKISEIDGANHAIDMGEGP